MKIVKWIEIIGLSISILFNLLPFIMPEKISHINAIIISFIGIIIVELVTIRLRQFTPSEQLMKLSGFFDLFKFKVNLDEIDLNDQVITYRLCKDFVADFENKLNHIAKKEISFEQKNIPDIGLDIIKNLKYCGFATVVVSKTLEDWRTPSGEEYLKECISVAKRIDGKFTRIFIIEDNYEVSPFLYKLLKQHNNSDIETLIAYKKSLDKYGVFQDLDFGVWDNKILVYVNKSPIGEGNKVTYIFDKGRVERESMETISKIRKACIDFDDFLADLKELINVKWENLLFEENKIVPPIAPSDEDLKVYRDILDCNVERLRNCLILGQTPQLVDLITELGCESIDVVDCAKSWKRLNKYTPKQIFVHTENWLDFRGETKYDVIIGDIVTNNLAIWQYYLFFENMAQNIAPDGVLILRILGKFFDSTEYTNIEFNDIISYFENNFIKCEISEIDLRLLMTYLLRFFHSHSYDQNKKAFKTNIWNQSLSKYISENGKDWNEYKILSHGYDLEISSLNLKELNEYYSDFFGTVRCEISESEDYKGLYKNFYRIFTWKLR